MTPTCWLLCFAVVLGSSVLVASTPAQRVWFADVVREAMRQSRIKQDALAAAQRIDKGQWSRALQGVGRIDVALLLDTAREFAPEFVRAFGRALMASVASDPETDRVAAAVEAATRAALADVRPRMARAELDQTERSKAACR